MPYQILKSDSWKAHLNVDKCQIKFLKNIGTLACAVKGDWRNWWHVNIYLNNFIGLLMFGVHMNIVRDISNSIFHSSAPHGCNPSRDYLDEKTREFKNNFARAVNIVNGNLRSNGDMNLDRKSAESYASDARQVERGELSNSGAHARASYRWAREGNLAGAVMNALAVLGSGHRDAADYKTGEILCK